MLLRFAPERHDGCACSGSRPRRRLADPRCTDIFEFANVTCSTSNWSSIRFTDLDVAFVEGMQGNASMQRNVIAQGADGCQARLSVSVHRTLP